MATQTWIALIGFLVWTGAVLSAGLYLGFMVRGKLKDILTDFQGAVIKYTDQLEESRKSLQIETREFIDGWLDRRRDEWKKLDEFGSECYKTGQDDMVKGLEELKGIGD